MDERSAKPRTVAMAGTIAALVWLTLAASQIERSVSGAELSLWRDVRLAIVRPLADAQEVIAAPPAPSAAASATPTFAPPTVVAGVEAAPESTVTPEPTATRAPRIATPSDPLRVLVIGDSLAGDLGRSLARITAAAGLVSVNLDYKPASGLSRPDYFDWDAELATDIGKLGPEVVVVMLGGNDAQSFEANGHVVEQGTAEWRAIYAKRVGDLMSVGASDDRRVIWIGLPVMADPSFGELMRSQNDLYLAAAARIARATYLDTWTLFAGPDGRYAPYLPDASGRPAAMRQADGIHLSLAGADRLASAVRSELEREDAFPAGSS